MELLGQRAGGLRGGVVAAIAFLAPSTVLMVACAVAYPFLRGFTVVGTFLDGMNAAMIGVIAAATLDLGRTAIRGIWDALAAAACAAVLAMRWLPEPILVFGAIFVGFALAVGRKDSAPKSERLHAFSPAIILFGSGAAMLPALARAFVPIGVMTFGGGLAMIPAIEHTVVVERSWLEPHAFHDAVALGQVTPGPVAICATFIGYRVGGLSGALVATIAMFGPALVVTLVAGHSIDRFRTNRWVIGALRALAPAVIGMLAAASVSLARAGIDWVGIVVATLSFVFVVRVRASPIWSLLGGGLVHVVDALVIHG